MEVAGEGGRQPGGTGDAQLAWQPVRPAPDQSRFSVGLAVFTWMAAVVFGFTGAVVIIAAAGYTDRPAKDYPLWLIATTNIPLWIGLLAGAAIVSRHWGTGGVRRDFGGYFRPIDLLGLPIGVVTQVVFVPALYVVVRKVGIDTHSLDAPAKELAGRAQGVGVALLVGLVVIGAPLVEELFFRGLVLRSIQARYNDELALVGSALLFGIAHFEPLQTFGLVLFGLIAAACAQRTRRLGMGVMAHAAFNATAVFQLLRR